MAEAAALAAGWQNMEVKKTAAVIPVTSGLGVISGFSQTVGRILQYYGIPAFVTEKTDVEGFFEAYRKKAEIVFAADDNLFIAVSTETKAIAENGACTGAGFAQALHMAAGGKIRTILVLGAGPVGCGAVDFFLKEGYSVDWYDIDRKKIFLAGKTRERARILERPPVLKNYAGIFDATTAKDIVTQADVTEKTVIAAPGMPCGITREAGNIAAVIHNPLELGVLTMYFDCLKKIEQEEEGFGRKENAGKVCA